MSWSRVISTGLVTLTCTWATVAQASASPPRSEGRLRRPGIVAEVAPDPLNELQRTVLAIAALDVLVDGVGLVDGYHAQFTD